MPVYDARYWFEHDQARYSSFVRDLAAFAAKLVRAGNSVFLFPTMWRDDDVIHDVIKVLSSEHMLALERDFAYRPNDSVQGLVDVIRSADIIVATRFHAAVLAYHLGLPVLGIGYYRKTRELMEQLGQGKYYLPFDKCGVDALWEKFVELDASRLAEAEAIARKTQDSRRRVEEQWDEVLGLVGFERPTRSSERVVPIGNLGAR
jgi:polysaccharide pyruvyl transferase WcaK-like protein